MHVQVDSRFHGNDGDVITTVLESRTKLIILVLNIKPRNGS
jgi:hypothetical protein